MFGAFSIRPTLVALLVLVSTKWCSHAFELHVDPTLPFEFDGIASAETQVFRESLNEDPRNNGTVDSRTSVSSAAAAETDASPGINPNAKVQLDAKCAEPMEVGNGSIQMSRFFFDVTAKTCRRFIYSGDGGNDNNFPTELECLNDCYIEVSEADPIREEDVVFIGDSSDERSVAGRPECLLPKDPGNCTGEVQSFYFMPEWQSCVAFRYTGCGGNENRFASRIECEQNCLVADGSVCRGPHAGVAPLKAGDNCLDTECPFGHVCSMGFQSLECCNTKDQDILRQAYATRCADASQAGGHFGEYFVATFAVTCDDLRCAPSERCVVSPPFSQRGNTDEFGGFAKCCRRDDEKPAAGGKFVPRRVGSAAMKNFLRGRA